MIQRGYVSAYGYGTNGSDIDTVALLARDMYANPQGAKIRVRAAAILEGKNEETIKQGGLSQWTDWLEYSPLPELADPQQLNDPSADSGEDGDGGASDAGSPSVPMAAQTWEQDNPAAIYQIWIGGQRSRHQPMERAGMYWQPFPPTKIHRSWRRQYWKSQMRADG